MDGGHPFCVPDRVRMKAAPGMIGRIVQCRPGQAMFWVKFPMVHDANGLVLCTARDLELVDSGPPPEARRPNA